MMQMRREEKEYERKTQGLISEGEGRRGNKRGHKKTSTASEARGGDQVGSFSADVVLNYEARRLPRNMCLRQIPFAGCAHIM